jgi:peptidoglycan/LPS O-acetylase OafA/YrhL
MVVFVHIFPDILPPAGIETLRWSTWWPFSGYFCVSLFFVVSGYSLSLRYLQTGDRRVLVQIGAGRYFRLMIPVLATCAMMSLLLNAGLIMPPEIRPDRFDLSWRFDPTLGHLLQFGLWDVFFNFTMENTYAGPLWSMSVELVGSFVLLGLLAVTRSFWALVVIAIALFNYPEILVSLYSLFIIGAACAAAPERLLRSIPAIVPPIIFVSGLVGVQMFGASSMVIVGSVTAFFVGSWLWEPGRQFFSNGFSKWLGNISFPLYLVHAPMIFAVGMPIYVWAGENFWLQLLAGTAALAASFAVARAFVVINDVAVKISRWIGQLTVSLLPQRTHQPAL